MLKGEIVTEAEAGAAAPDELPKVPGEFCDGGGVGWLGGAAVTVNDPIVLRRETMLVHVVPNREPAWISILRGLVPDGADRFPEFVLMYSIKSNEQRRIRCSSVEGTQLIDRKTEYPTGSRSAFPRCGWNAQDRRAANRAVITTSSVWTLKVGIPSITRK